MTVLEALFVAGVTGAISSAATIAAIKTDVWWIKKVLKRHDVRITKLEEQKT